MSMQIQPTIAAGAAAGTVSQSSSKDRTSASAAEPSAQATPAAVEKVARSEQASADRDAQGGSYGPNPRPHHVTHSHQPPPAEHESLPVKPPEPPSLLDIVG